MITMNEICDSPFLYGFSNQNKSYLITQEI